MPTITINEKKVETPTGTPLIQLLKQDLSLPCGGHGTMRQMPHICRRGSVASYRRGKIPSVKR